MRSSVVRMQSAVLVVTVTLCASLFMHAAGMAKRQAGNPCLKPGRVDTNLAVVWKKLNDPARRDEVTEVLQCLLKDKDCTFNGQAAKRLLCNTVFNFPPGCYDGFLVCASECQKAVNASLSLPPFGPMWEELKQKLARNPSWCKDPASLGGAWA